MLRFVQMYSDLVSGCIDCMGYMIKVFGALERMANRKWQIANRPGPNDRGTRNEKWKTEMDAVEKNKLDSYDTCLIRQAGKIV